MYKNRKILVCIQDVLRCFPVLSRLPLFIVACLGFSLFTSSICGELNPDVCMCPSCCCAVVNGLCVSGQAHSCQYFMRVLASHLTLKLASSRSYKVVWWKQNLRSCLCGCLLRLLLVPVGIVKRMTFEFCLLRSLSPGRLALTYVFYSSPAVFFGGEGGILENLLGGLCEWRHMWLKWTPFPPSWILDISSK